MIEVVIVVDRAKYSAKISARPNLSLQKAQKKANKNSAFVVSRWTWNPVRINFKDETPDLTGVKQLDLHIGEQAWTLYQPVLQDGLLAYERAIQWEPSESPTST